MNAPPTKKQKAILAFIAAEMKRRGLPPTIREIGARFDIRSTNGVNDHLKALERKGLLSRGTMRARDLRLTSRGLCVVGETSNRCPMCSAEVAA